MPVWSLFCTLTPDTLLPVFSLSPMDILFPFPVLRAGCQIAGPKLPPNRQIFMRISSRKYETSSQCWLYVGSPSATLTQHKTHYWLNTSCLLDSLSATYLAAGGFA